VPLCESNVVAPTAPAAATTATTTPITASRRRVSQSGFSISTNITRNVSGCGISASERRCRRRTAESR
jgi:hypothetical protein